MIRFVACVCVFISCGKKKVTELMAALPVRRKQFHTRPPLALFNSDGWQVPVRQEQLTTALKSLVHHFNELQRGSENRHSAG